MGNYITTFGSKFVIFHNYPAIPPAWRVLSITFFTFYDLGSIQIKIRLNCNILEATDRIHRKNLTWSSTCQLQQINLKTISDMEDSGIFSETENAPDYPPLGNNVIKVGKFHYSAISQLKEFESSQWSPRCTNLWLRETCVTRSVLPLVISALPQNDGVIFSENSCWKEAESAGCPVVGKTVFIMYFFIHGEKRDMFTGFLSRF